MSTLGPIMLDLEGLALTSEEKEILRHPQVGGVILFTRNYHSPEQLRHLIQQIRAAQYTHLLIAVDHEGGRVQRFRDGFTQLPAMGEMGALYASSPEQAKTKAKQLGHTMASELRAYDLDFSFAPVLDLDKGVSEVIGNRAFHRDPQIVIALSKAFIDGMHSAGMAAIGKHFPGHGSVAPDSHIDIPVDKRSLNDIMQDDAIPFIELTKNNIQGLMPAHIVFEQVDPLPVGFSQYWLQTILRQQLNFQGAIFSDDLSMAGASMIGDMNERAKQALLAGCDCILVCNDRPNASKVLEYLERNAVKRDAISNQRMLKCVLNNSRGHHAHS
jgi:beta-N-acetylhexosaminidase